ncbi:hypothetical protein FF38_00976 [Lucilia cuprina]|uniref:Protein sleepless n=1 Tax=Lucilia cuprina TaxID=7375 RepID=A0A0L0BUA6_LUCCU|nr:U-scoloptoxin(05)-Cw1a [Lucilia cuprina]KNC23627.1 hypothetical protein FF38_00976 [Lucilia cuprina]
MWQKLFLQSLLLSAALSSVMAINCYVCDASDTNNPFQCGEWFERFDDPDLQPQNCSNVHDAKFCIKHVGRFEGGIGAKRFCSSKDLGNYCDYVRNKGDRMDYRSCIYTCNTDGCNGASSLHLTQLLLPSVVGVVAVLAVMRLKILW